MKRAGLEPQLDWISLCYGCSSGSLVPSAHSLATHPFLPQCVEEPEDLIACYLRSLCRSPLICRPILLDFSLDRKPSKILQPGKQTLLAFVIFSMGRKELSHQAVEGELPSLPTKQDIWRIFLELVGVVCACMVVVAGENMFY